MMEEAFGPYPFSELGGVVPVHDFWFGGLETQPRRSTSARRSRTPPMDRSW